MQSKMGNVRIPIQQQYGWGSRRGESVSKECVILIKINEIVLVSPSKYYSRTTPKSG